jgi:hypothetical protein
MTWHDNASASHLTNERGDAVAVIVREARGGEKCRLYVKHDDRAPLPLVGTFATVDAAKARVEVELAAREAAAA